MGKSLELFISSNSCQDSDGYYKKVVIEAKQSKSSIRKIELLNFKTDNQMIIDSIYRLCDMSAEDVDSYFLNFYPALILSSEGFVVETKNGTFFKMIDGYGLGRHHWILDIDTIKCEHIESIYDRAGFQLCVNNEFYIINYLKKYENIENEENDEAYIQDYIGKIGIIIEKLCDKDVSKITNYVAKARFIGVIDKIT